MLGYKSNGQIINMLSPVSQTSLEDGMMIFPE